MKKLLFFSVLLSVIFIFSGCVVSDVFNKTENDIYNAFTDSFIEDNSSFEEFLASDVFYTKKVKTPLYDSSTETNSLKSKEFIAILRDLGVKYSSDPYTLKEISKKTREEADYTVIILQYTASKDNSPEKVFLNFELYYKNFNEGKITNNYLVDTVNLVIQSDMVVSDFFEGGEGTETSPYLISNEKQLDYMRYF
ncbi:hypothetical protein, partial [Geotoga petraea]|uniref:hypothetical protein n=1 Tax=Geotoga petraea TaxID=28234 RepID=UPI001436C381